MAQEAESLQQRARRLARAFASVAALTYGLIVLGALVRAHGAGLACPDWPLCFGELVPRFDLRVAFEYSHRVAAGTISLLFLGCAVAALRDDAIRAASGRLLVVTAGVLGVQILLGALTVWHLLASWTVTAHLLTGNTFALCLAFTARRLYRLAAPPVPRPPVPRALRIVLLATAVLLFCQMVLGGLVSSTYAGLACSEWPTCNGGVFFPSFEGALGIHLLHRLGAYSLVMLIAVAAWLGRDQAGIAGWLRLALAVVLAQVGVGVANVLLRLPLEVTGLHSALAAGLVLCVALSFAETWSRPAAA